MGMIENALAAVAPRLALRRARDRAALSALMHYDAATTGTRGSSWRPNAADADGAAARRQRLAAVARDMIRNTPFALRAQQVIANNVVGDGIIWKVKSTETAATSEMRPVLRKHFDTTAIDADGRCNLYGLQRLALCAVIDAGEVLIRRRRRSRSDGLPLPFQIQVIEADFLDTSKDGSLPNGNIVREGIEFDAIGRRVGYWLFPEHPGARTRLRGQYWTSSLVPAKDVLHIYRQDRPGQMRGVSWFAPVAMSLQDMGDHQDAQLMRQKVAACFAAFRIPPEDEPAGSDNAGLSSIIPGRIQNLAPGEDIKFAAPPGVEAYDEFTRSVLRAVAAGMGITYEALTGDLSNVNFSSGRMGRMEMDRNVSAWQWLLMLPQMMEPLTSWTIEAMEMSLRRMPKSVEIEWVPPYRVLVDPSKEIAALRDKVKAGFASRQGVIRELGFDPEDLLAEQVEDRDKADAARLVFDSDARVTMPGQAPNNAGMIGNE